MNELGPTSKIGRTNTANGSNKEKSVPITSSKPSLDDVDKVTLSGKYKDQDSISKSKTSNSEIRNELVSKFRNVLQNNSYEVKANEIADKIVQKIRENKNHLAL
jgi:anti-sigma28 factor (negative regulator of flagellin synthesis)